MAPDAPQDRPRTAGDEDLSAGEVDADEMDADEMDADEVDADEVDADEMDDDEVADPQARGKTADAAAGGKREAGRPAGKSRRRSRPRDRSTQERHALRKRRRQVALPSAPTRRGPIKRRVADLFRVVEARAERSERRHARAGAYALHVAAHVVRQWARDRCPEKAASLAFQTVLSVVPLLAVLLAVLRGTGHIDAQSSFVEFLGHEFIPVSTDVIAEKLTEWSDNVNLKSLGLVGLIASVLVAFVMVNSIEKTINAIWRAERKRPLSQKFIIFYATATIGPFLVGASLYQASQFGWTAGYKGLFISIISSFGALFLANFFLPALRVRLGPALLGALVSMVLFEIARVAFRAYVTEFAFASFSGVYGPLSLAPIWLLWVYYSWLVFLLGIEVAHVAQNLQLLQGADRRQSMSLENEILQRVNGVTAARVMMAISAAYMGGDKIMPKRTLEEIFDLSPDVLRRITDRLKQHDLIIEVPGEQDGFLPALPPSEIALATVLGAFRSSDATFLETRGRTQLDSILADIDRNARLRTQDIYFDDLVRGKAE